jgi:hypothetical protein
VGYWAARCSAIRAVISAAGFSGSAPIRREISELEAGCRQQAFKAHRWTKPFFPLAGAVFLPTSRIGEPW